MSLWVSVAAELLIGVLFFFVAPRVGFAADNVPSVQTGIAAATVAGMLALSLKALLMRPSSTAAGQLKALMTAQGLSFALRLGFLALPLVLKFLPNASPIFQTLSFFFIYLVQQPIEMRYVLARKATTS